MKTFYEALDEYLVLKETTLKPYSLVGIKYRVGRLKDLVANLKLEQLDTQEIQDYVDEWGKSYSASTIKSFLIIIKEVLKLNGFLIGKIKVKQENKKLRLYNKDEVKQIEDYLTTHKIKRNQLSLPIALYTGLRIGEVLALQWLDVDLDRRLISVSKNTVLINGIGKIIQDPKTQSSVREVAIPIQLYDILLKFKPKDNEDWEKFVTSDKNAPQCSRTAQRSIEYLLCKAGVEWRGFHAFRHTYATRMLENGIPPKAISDMLGHRDINTTLNIYSHTTNDFKKECVDKVFENENYNNTRNLLKEEQEKKELYQQILEMQKTMNELLLKVSNI